MRRMLNDKKNVLKQIMETVEAAMKDDTKVGKKYTIVVNVNEDGTVSFDLQENND